MIFACLPGIVIWGKRTTRLLIFASWVLIILDVANETHILPTLPTISPTTFWIHDIFASTNWAFLIVAAFEFGSWPMTISSVWLLNFFGSSDFSATSSTCLITSSFSPWTPFTIFWTKFRTGSLATSFHIWCVFPCILIIQKVWPIATTVIHGPGAIRPVISTTCVSSSDQAHQW